MWTFGKKIAAGFAIALILLAVIGVTAYLSIESFTVTSYRVTHTHAVLEKLALLDSAMKDAETGQRGFVITGDDTFLDPYHAGITAAALTSNELRELTTDNPNQQRRLTEADALIAAKLAELKRTIDLRRSAGFEPTQKVVTSREGKTYMDDLRRVLDQMEHEERALLTQRAGDVEHTARRTRITLVAGTLTALLLMTAVGVFLTRTLSRQIGTAVNQVQCSSAELQAAATQQATGSREQATAMSEITMTIHELLATSRQITESAQQVAQIAEQTAAASRSGDATVGAAHESIDSIRRQVDEIVSHMLELGKKSQQIGAVLDIVSELAEQTNILAINATIEAAGAGETGKRFSVVADEIRKLADRVAGSARDIRELIDDVRSAVNTTVMTTETGSKTVDAGAKQFGRVAVSFTQIRDLVATTTQAAREIELSTKQQATAVEQVNLAIADIARAAKETQVSSDQTQQTAAQLAHLSQDLLRLVQPQAA